MKPLFLIVSVALLSGCATFSSLPPEAKQIRRVGVSSERVYVWNPTLKYQGSGYVLHGAVRERGRPGSPIRSRLQVVIYDAAGNILWDKWVDFTPAEPPIAWSQRDPTGTYNTPLGVLPPGTACIVVRAQDAPDASPRSS